MSNLKTLCVCGKGVHIGSVVRFESGSLGGTAPLGGPVTGVVATVRTEPAHDEITTVYPTIPAREEVLAITVIITVSPGFLAPAVGEYMTTLGIVDGIGCTA